MRVPRFHVAGPLTAGAGVDLHATAGAHLARVLRARVGSPVVLFDGRGGEYEARIASIGKRVVHCQVGRFVDVDRESALDLTLAQGISRGERMDYTLQKAVELGVARIVPLATARSTVRLDAARSASRLQHWRGVVVSACEQCGRCRVPPVRAPAALADWLADDRPALRLVLRAEAPRTLAQLPPPAGPVTVLIGPEGGLAPEEIDAAGAAGYTPVRLGPRILRTETAAVVALAALQALWGDLQRR
ncbi:MAG: 16S rRNA (uracil(1498)-N(3))-methyltransferase [Gammaproteobacteria bacterium]|nr:16S rRNA (uracil(1498)-N(3))-methyltransferase [Gammaproteobacteria bacterium]